MTERFSYEYDIYNGTLFDNKYNTFYPIEDSESNLELLCDRLNELDDKVKKLLYINNALIEICNKREDENTELKNVLKELQEIDDYYEGRIKELSKENMEYYQLVNCGNCKHHTYDWLLGGDGEEFEVCSKGNTDRLLYHKFCKEWEEL